MAARKKSKVDDEIKSPGKFMIALGGFGGFALPFAGSFFNGNSAWSSLLYGGLGCVLCAYLMKRFAVYIENNIDRLRKEKVEIERLRRLKEEMEDEEDEMPESREMVDIR